MRRSLSVIFLAVMAAVFAVSSAFALDSYTFAAGSTNATNSSGNVGATFTDNTLTINASGQFSFADDYGTVTIDSVDFSGAVGEVVLVLPDQTVGGTWGINWPSQANGQAISHTNRLKFTVKAAGTSSAIQANSFSWAIPSGVEFTLNVPLKDYYSADDHGATTHLYVDLTVSDDAVMTFGSDAKIFASAYSPNIPTGYVNTAYMLFSAAEYDTSNPYADSPSVGGNYTVQPGGELVIQNEYAIRGSKLNVYVAPGVGSDNWNAGERAKLTLDLPKGTSLDLRGMLSATELERPNTGGVISSVYSAETHEGTATYDPYADDSSVTTTTTVTTDSYTLDPSNRYAAQYDGARLNIGGELKVVNDITFCGYIDAPPEIISYDASNHGHPIYGDASFYKTGAGKITFTDAGTASDGSLSYYGKWALPDNLRYLNVEEGTIELASQLGTWGAGRGLTPAASSDSLFAWPVVRVNTGAELIVGSKSIEEVTEDDIIDDDLFIGSIEFHIFGTVTFKNHAIVKRDGSSTMSSPVFNEIYPYEDYVNSSTEMKINAWDVMLYIASEGKVIIDNGVLPIGRFYGDGEIEIRNTIDSSDRSVLILCTPLGESLGVNDINDEAYAHHYIDFEGKIYGQGANFGLSSAGSYRVSSSFPFSRRLFRSADVTLDNLIVYGSAQFNVNGETIDRLANVSNIWLRSNRPGADNSSSATANSNLTIGTLNFIPTDASKQEIYVNGLKVDGSSSAENFGEIRILHYDNDATNASDYAGTSGTAGQAPRYYDYNANANRADGSLGPRTNVYISNLQLYANRGTGQDFETAYANPSTGIYALNLMAASHMPQPSRYIIDGTTVTGDGLAEDVANGVYQVQFDNGTDVEITGINRNDDYYPLARNNSLMVASGVKLAIDRGGIIDGNLMFYGSSQSLPDYGSETYPTDADFHSDNGWYSSRLSGYTTFSTQIHAENRTTYSDSDYAVRVTGSLTTSRDSFSTSSGPVLVNPETEVNAFSGYEFTTIGQRFKVLGSSGSFGGDFATSYHQMHQYRIPASDADTNGVIVENRTEMAVPTLGDYSFLVNADSFGSGEEFVIKVPFYVTIRGQKVPLKSTTGTDGSVHYYAELEDWGRYYFKLTPQVDGGYGHGLGSTYTSDSLSLRLEIDVGDDENYIRVIGTSSVDVTPSLVILLGINEDDGLDSAGLSNTMSFLNGSFSTYREYVFERNGSSGGSNSGSGSNDPYVDDSFVMQSYGTMYAGDTLIEGRTYFMRFRTNSSSAVTWSVTDNTEGKVIHHSSTVTASSNDVFIVELTPKTSADEQSFTITASDGSDMSGWEVMFSVEPEDEDIKTAYQTLPATSGSHDDVRAGYRVNFPSGIVASDTASVWLPSWLKAIINDDDEVIGVEFNDAAPEFANDITATVTVEAENADGNDVYYQWNVTRKTSATADIEPVIVEPEASTLDFTDPEFVARIIRLLQAILGIDLTGVDVAAFDGQIVERSTSDIQDGEVPSGQQVAVCLPIMMTSVTRISVFSVQLNLPRGSRIYMHTNPRRASASDVLSAAAGDDDDEGDAIFLDEDGNQITYTTEDNQTVNVAAYMEAGVEYAPVVTTPVSGGEDSGGDTPGSDTPTPSTPSWSGNNDPYADYADTNTPSNTNTSGEDVELTSNDVEPTSNDVVPVSNDVAPTTSSDTSPVTPDTPSGGQDTIDPYNTDRWDSAARISTAEALLGLLSRINGGSEPVGRYYVIEADIDLSGQNWQGIGTEAHPFTGHFNGNGHTVTCPALIGFFGIIRSDGVAVRNLTVRRASASASGLAGGVVSSASPSEIAGGIAQELISGTIEDCSFSGNVSTSGEDSSAGGIVGKLSGGTIRNCRVLSGSGISAAYSAGGIAGYVSGGEISECSSSATVSAQYSGGIAGFSETDRTNIKSNSFTEADYEVGNDASRLTLTPVTQTVQEGSDITAITFSNEGISSWSFTADVSGLASRDNAVIGTIPYDTPAGLHTITVDAIMTNGTRIAGQATINVTRVNVNGGRNFMDYTFDMPPGIRSGIAEFFGVDNIYQLTQDEIISETWQVSRADLQEIAGMNMRVVLTLPEIRPARSGVYLLKLTLLDLSVGAALGIHGITGSSQVSSSALENMEYAFFDENGREVKTVPPGKVVYAALRLSSGRTHRSVVTAPNELQLGTIQPFTPDDELLGKIADTVNISADKLHLLEDENIREPQDPTQAMLDEMARRESNPVGKMNTIIVSRDGYYVMKVVLSDDLYEQHIKGVKAEDLKAYVLYDNGDSDGAEVSASFITGLLNTWELLTLKGEKLEFGAKEFLMVGFLNAGTPFSVYLTKLILALLMGGCDSGLGLAGLGVLAGAVILLMRRRR